MSRQRWISALAPVIALPLVVVPLLMWPGQMYDGVRMSLAAQENDLSGFWLFAGRAGWEAQFALLWVENLVGDAFGVGFRPLDLVVAILALGLVSWEAGKIAGQALSLPRDLRVATILLTLAFPSWQVLASSIHTFHVLCIGAGLVGVRVLLTASSRARGAVGFILVVGGMQLSSNLVLLPVVALVWHNPVVRWSGGVGRSKWVLLTSITLFFGRWVLFPNEAPYDDYNVFINPFTSFGVRDYVLNLLGFSSVVLALLTVAVTPVVVSLGPSAVSRAVRSDLVRGPALMTAASVLPYVLVGKSANFFGYGAVIEWLFRHALPLGPSVALLTVTFTWAAANQSLESGTAVRAGLSVCFALLSLFLLVGGLAKAGRRHFEVDVAASMEPVIESVPSGHILIHGAGMPSPSFRPDEANYLGWSRLGRRDLWWYLTPDEVVVTSDLREPGTRGEQLDLVFEGTEGSTCVTEVELDISGYGPLSILKAGSGSSVSIRSISTTC